MKRFVVVVLGVGALLAPAAVASGGRTVNTFGKDSPGCRVVLTASLTHPGRAVAPCNPKNATIWVNVKGGWLLVADLGHHALVSHTYGQGVVAKTIERDRGWHIAVATTSEKPVRVLVKLVPPSR